LPGLSHLLSGYPADIIYFAKLELLKLHLNYNLKMHVSYSVS
jgi:hypothetical protein